MRSVDVFVHCLRAPGDTVLHLYKHLTLLSVELPKDICAQIWSFVKSSTLSTIYVFDCT